MCKYNMYINVQAYTCDKWQTKVIKKILTNGSIHR